jgi:anti-sigma B factor antagonist
MLNINKTKDGDKMVVALEGRLDTTTAPELEVSVKEDIAGVADLVIDLEQLEYISSAGLRVLLATQKIMNSQGQMVVTHPNDVISEVFEVTGFCDILTIE